MVRGGKVPGYKPPIEAVRRELTGKIEQSLEDGIMRILHDIDIHVDKEELIKALKYDRGQYEKGFRDGVKSTQKHGNWHIRSAYLTEPADSPFWKYCMECSECGRKVEGISVEDAINYRKLCREYPYCHCGAKMDGGNEDA